jgi:hypothetical protein
VIAAPSKHGIEQFKTGVTMRILIIGAGAVGGYFGGRLAQAGRDATFLVRSRRAEQLKKSGLKIISPHGDFTITPRLVATGEIHSACDVVLIETVPGGAELAGQFFDECSAVGAASGLSKSAFRGLICNPKKTTDQV